MKYKLFTRQQKATYKINLPTNLIQVIRAYQAIAEAGVSLSIAKEDENKFNYLARFFKIKYKIEDPNAIVLQGINVDHNKPEVTVGSVKLPLLFPKSIFDVCEESWGKNRPIKVIFVGLPTEKRRKIIKKWQGKQNNKNTEIKIFYSDKGRIFPQKAWDASYYEKLCSSEFVLCPNGDFIWTYRFFESVMCGAIPIIEEFTSIYEGFYYHKMEDDLSKLSWSKDKAVHNFKLAKKMLTLEKDKILRELKMDK